MGLWVSVPAAAGGPCELGGRLRAALGVLYLLPVLLLLSQLGILVLQATVSAAQVRGVDTRRAGCCSSYEGSVGVIARK